MQKNDLGSSVLGIWLGVELFGMKKESDYQSNSLFSLGAGDGSRTRNPQLGRLMLCQLSYSRFLVLWSHFIARQEAIDQ
jgi:hypothetical protein